MGYRFIIVIKPMPSWSQNVNLKKELFLGKPAVVFPMENWRIANKYTSWTSNSMVWSSRPKSGMSLLTKNFEDKFQIFKFWINDPCLFYKGSGKDIVLLGCTSKIFLSLVEIRRILRMSREKIEGKKKKMRITVQLWQ